MDLDEGSVGKPRCANLIYIYIIQATFKARECCSQA
jgi:hypothetical protein